MHYDSGKEGELSQEEEYILSNPYHLVTLPTQLLCDIFVIYIYCIVFVCSSACHLFYIALSFCCLVICCLVVSYVNF
jgi:hypothetical protein